MVTFALSVNDGATELLDRLMLSSPRFLSGITKTLGLRASELLKDHYRAVNASYQGKGRDYLGGATPQKRLQFWAEVSDSISNPKPDGPGRVRISIGYPAFLQKLKGGTIKPKQAKYLTIPTQPESYGRTAQKFADAEQIKLFVLHSKSGMLSLAAKDGSGKIKVYYLLRKSVEQEPDAKALPDMDKFHMALQKTSGEFLSRWVAGSLE